MNGFKLLTTIALLAACGCKAASPDELKAAPASISVKTTTVKTQPMANSLPLTGSLVANQQADVAANAIGRILKTFVERGSFVNQGDSLVQIDSKSFALNLKEAEANLKNALATNANSESQCVRNEELFKKGIITAENWEKVQTQCATAAGTVDVNRTKVEISRKAVVDATIRAPFSGIVGERFISVGEYVQASTKVASVVQVDPVRIQLSVPENNIGLVAVGNTVRFRVSAFPGESFEGKITFVAPSIRVASRDLIFEAVVQNSDGRLRPGMFAEADLAMTDVPTPVIPATSLRKNGEASIVFTVVDGRIHERIVQVGPESDGLLPVLDGLRDGESVVTEPGQDVKDGLSVN